MANNDTPRLVAAGAAVVVADECVDLISYADCVESGDTDLIGAGWIEAWMHVV